MYFVAESRLQARSIWSNFLPSLLLSLGFISPAFGLTYGTPDSVAMRNIGAACEVYKGEHGNFPEGWNNISSYYNEPLDRAFGIKLIERYAFLKPAESPSIPREGKIILMGRSPFRDRTLSMNSWGGITRGFTEPGRFILYEQADGKLGYRFLPEAKIQQLFHDAHLPLPEPDHLGPHPNDTAYMTDQRVGLIWNFALSLGGFLLLAWLISRWRQKQGRQPKPA